MLISSFQVMFMQGIIAWIVSFRNFIAFANRPVFTLLYDIKISSYKNIVAITPAKNPLLDR